jgi:hypothetical protein
MLSITTIIPTKYPLLISIKLINYVFNESISLDVQWDMGMGDLMG